MCFGPVTCHLVPSGCGQGPVSRGEATPVVRVNTCYHTLACARGVSGPRTKGVSETIDGTSWRCLQIIHPL